MDKRVLLAVVLSCLVLMVWQIFFAPRPVPRVPSSGAVPEAPATSVAAKGTTGSATEPPSVGAPASGSAEVASGGQGATSTPVRITPKRQAPEDAPPVVVETELMRVEFANPGGRLVSWQLKKYLDDHGRPYEIVPADAAELGGSPLQFRMEDKPLERLLNTSARFDLERGEAPSNQPTSSSEDGTRPPLLAGAKEERLPGSPGEERIRLVFSDGMGLEADKTLAFRKDSYLVELSATVSRGGRPVTGEIVWGPGIGRPSAEDLSNRYYRGGTVVADLGGSPARFYKEKTPEPKKLEGSLRWVGLEEQYFAAVFIPADGTTGAEIVPVYPPLAPPASAGDASSASGKPGSTQGGSSPAKTDAKTTPVLAIAVPLGETYTLFVGPKDYRLLLALGRGLPSIINFKGFFPLLGPLVEPIAKILYVVLRWLYSFLHNYGLAIILLTTAIKIAFYPLTQRTMVKMRKVQQDMQRIQPKVKAIQEKHRKAKNAASRAKMNEEIMALYQREGINPMASLGGCLPLLIQLPILYAFYSILTVSIELRQAPFFGWITDLSRKDPYYVTPLLMGATMFLQQKMAMTKVTDPQQRAQQRMMLIMPVIFTWTFLWLPSGLVLYWFVNNVLGILQQVLINRQAATIAASAAPAVGKA